jgi:hypothetical protein
MAASRTPAPPGSIPEDRSIPVTRPERPYADTVRSTVAVSVTPDGRQATDTTVINHPQGNQFERLLTARAGQGGNYDIVRRESWRDGKGVLTGATVDHTIVTPQGQYTTEQTRIGADGSIISRGTTSGTARTPDGLITADTPRDVADARFILGYAPGVTTTTGSSDPKKNPTVTHTPPPSAAKPPSFKPG